MPAGLFYPIAGGGRSLPCVVPIAKRAAANCPQMISQIAIITLKRCNNNNKMSVLGRFSLHVSAIMSALPESHGLLHMNVNGIYCSYEDMDFCLCQVTVRPHMDGVVNW